MDVLKAVVKWHPISNKLDPPALPELSPWPTKSQRNAISPSEGKSSSRIEVQAAGSAGSQTLLALLQWWLQNHCKVGRDHSLTKIISAKGQWPRRRTFHCRPQEEQDNRRQNHSHAVAALDGEHAWEIHTKAPEPHCKSKDDNLDFYRTVPLIFSHSGEKKWRPLRIFPFKKCQWRVWSLNFHDRGRAHSITSLVEMLVSAGSITWQLDTLVY